MMVVTAPPGMDASKLGITLRSPYETLRPDKVSEPAGTASCLGVEFPPGCAGVEPDALDNEFVVWLIPWPFVTCGQGDK